MLGVDLPDADPASLMDRLDAGLPAQTLKRFKVATGLTDDQISSLLRIGGRTLTRVKGSRARRLPADLSDRLYAIASIYALASAVLGSHEAGIGWMSEPQFAFANRPPLDLLSTELGRGQVRELLNQIEYGILA
jgi:putative toxin-antitoxin system antitoxin component (TIGR02293 family)